VIKIRSKHLENFVKKKSTVDPDRKNQRNFLFLCKAPNFSAGTGQGK
jgi:hypothetical protein